MKQVKQHEKTKHVLIIEPAANLYIGHMREKLEVMTSALGEIGCGYDLVTWEIPSKHLSPPPAAIHVLSPLLRRLIGWVPSRWRTRTMEFFIYLKGFREAAARNLGVIGMTTSDPYGPLAASILCCPGPAYVQRMFNHGLRLHEGKFICSIPRLIAYDFLVRGGGSLVLFTDLLRDHITGFRTSLREKTRVIPELTQLPSSRPSAPGAAVMLVSGLDNARRAPLLHIAKIHQPVPLKEIIIQYQEDIPLSDLQAQVGISERAFQLTWINKYFTGDDWEALFKRAGFTLVAYDSRFASISAILLQSVIFGVPVLSSRFPDAVENFGRHGQLGEMFEYGDPDDFNKALRKILAWNEKDYSKFETARISLLESLRPTTVAGHYLALLGGRSVS